MIYPSDFEQKIGFDRVRRQTERLCISERAREMLAGTAFSSDFRVVETALSRTDEMRTILLMENDFPQDHFVDVHGVLRRIEVAGAYLLSEDLVVIRRALIGIGELIAFFRRKDGKYLRLNELLDNVDAFPELIRRIDSIIDRFGQVKDSASFELQTIRREIADRESQISKVLHRVLRAAQASGVVDADAALSVRDGRTVIPVSAANKRKINGFIHDESATGKTFYVEPVEVVELNNELKELGYSEKREIVRILVDFTDELRPHTDGLRASGEFLAAIDFIRAKAKWALENDATKPIFFDTPSVGLKNARHPLLAQALAKEGKKVVPLTLSLDSQKHMLVVSGPNAGGKSVVLKTIGLLQYMIQAGFRFKIAVDFSEMGIFRSLFLDMGDEQSIDNDLSTYSSHLLNMKTMLRSADEKSLVLIDEFGSGTEPVMGAAIAEAVLQQLEEHQVFAIITTHYANLKYYASNAKGILNGAMAFDVQQIDPLFKLEVGKPGSSFAIEIARKIGLPERIIQSATEKAGSEHVNIERQLREIARDKRYWEEKRDRIRLAEKRADELAERYGRELDELKSERNKLLKSAKEESQRILNEANKNIEQTIREIRESQAEKEKTKLARQKLDDFRMNIDAGDAESLKIDTKIQRLRERERQRAERKLKRGEMLPENNASMPSFIEKPHEIGDKVRIRGQHAIGEIIQLQGGKAVIGIGQILTTINADNLERIPQNEYRKITRDKQTTLSHSAHYDTSKRRLNFSQQIDLRGERTADALGKVQEYIDEAIMLGIPEVKILHGKGTGALKEEIRRYLSTVSAVSSATDEDEKFGGAGITVVRF